MGYFLESFIAARKNEGGSLSFDAAE